MKKKLIIKRIIRSHLLRWTNTKYKWPERRFSDLGRNIPLFCLGTAALVKRGSDTMGERNISRKDTDAFGLNSEFEVLIPGMLCVQF